MSQVIEPARATALATELRRLRRDRKWTLARLAIELHVSRSLAAGFESGKHIPMPDTAKALDNLYRTGEQIQKMSGEAHADRRPWLRSWRETELRATLLRSWEPNLIPALLQTEAYARAIVGLVAPARDVDGLVAARLEHAAAVASKEIPRRFVIAEAALRRVPAEIRREQLELLLEAGRLDRVSIRVLPVERDGLHAGANGPIALATLPDGRRLGYVDDALRGTVAPAVADLQLLELRWEDVSELSLTSAETEMLLARMINELE